MAIDMSDHPPFCTRRWLASSSEVDEWVTVTLPEEDVAKVSIRSSNTLYVQYPADAEDGTARDDGQPPWASGTGDHYATIEPSGAFIELSFWAGQRNSLIAAAETTRQLNISPIEDGQVVEFILEPRG